MHILGTIRNFTLSSFTRMLGTPPVTAGFILIILLTCLPRAAPFAHAEEPSAAWEKIAPYFTPPAEYAGKIGAYRSPLRFDDGTEVKTPADWKRRRAEILGDWHRIMGKWPLLIDKPKIEYVQTVHRENFTQHKIRLEISPGRSDEEYLLIPDGKGPFPAVVVTFYGPLDSIGEGKSPLIAWGHELTKRGFVTLSIGGPSGRANTDKTDDLLQPLSYMAYVASNCYNALATLPQVDAKRVGIVGHSYGGKWAMFASCLDDRYAAAVWSDPGIVWNESHANVNYWEKWYLGLDKGPMHKEGLVTAANPRSGAYKTLVETGHDIHELHALMAPRPFLVSGGSEDKLEEWTALNHSVAVNQLLGYSGRVGMTTRQGHRPTPESNEVLYAFFEHFLAGK